MPWKPDVSRGEAPRDSRLDFVRDAVAEVSDGAMIGYVAFRVEPWWTRTGGHLWWSRWDQVEERVEFLETAWLDRANVGDGSKGLVDSGVVWPDSTWLDDLRRGVYVFIEPSTVPGEAARRRSLTVRWLEGSELALARAQWGFGVP